MCCHHDLSRVSLIRVCIVPCPRSDESARCEAKLLGEAVGDTSTSPSASAVAEMRKHLQGLPKSLQHQIRTRLEATKRSLRQCGLQDCLPVATQLGATQLGEATAGTRRRRHSTRRRRYTPPTRRRRGHSPPGQHGQLTGAKCDRTCSAADFKRWSKKDKCKAYKRHTPPKGPHKPGECMRSKKLRKRNGRLKCMLRR